MPSSYGWAVVALAFLAILGLIGVWLIRVQRSAAQRAQLAAEVADIERKARAHGAVAEARAVDHGELPGVRVRDRAKPIRDEIPGPAGDRIA